MTLILDDVVSWFKSPDCEFLKFGCGKSPCLLRIYSWSFYLLEGACYDTFNFIFMDSQPLSFVGHLRFMHVCCYRRCPGDPYPCKLPPSIRSTILGWCLCQEYIFGFIQVPNSMSTYITEVSTALPWRHAWLARLWRPLFFEVTCSLARFLYFLPSRSVLFTRRSWWPFETIGPVLLVWKGCVYSPYSLNWFLEDWLAFSIRFQNSAGLISPLHIFLRIVRPDM